MISLSFQTREKHVTIMDALSLQFPLSRATFSQLLFTNLYYVCPLTTTWMPYSLGCLLYLTGNRVKYTSLSAQAFVLWYKTASPAELPVWKQYCSTMFLSPDLLKINNIVGYLNIYYIGNQTSDHVQTGKKKEERWLDYEIWFSNMSWEFPSWCSA